MTELPSRWRILRDPPGAAAWNMAVDEAVARGLPRDEGVLRIYRWARPTLSFGRNQTAAGRYDPDVFGPLGAEAVRRPTGGREVLHDRELTYSVVLPLGGPQDLRAVYRLVNEGLVAALRSLNVEARLASRRGPPPDPNAGACFRKPAANEIEVDGRKLVGSAQARLGRTLLQHGSLLLGPSSVELAALSLPPATEGDVPRQGGVGLAELTGHAISFGRVAAAVEAALAGVLGGRWGRGELRPDERCSAASLTARYGSSSWTWRC